MKKLFAMLLICTMLMMLCGTAFAEEAPAVANGELLDIAQVMVKAAMNKAEEINVPMVITVMDMDGNVVLFHRMKGSLLASMEISQNKAYTAVALKMPSETVKDLAVEGAELQSIAVQHAGKIVEFGGGFPIINPDGVQIGGIGVSGGSVAEDTSVAQAGLDAYKKAKEIKAASGGVLLDKAILARHFGVPFYVAAPISTFDPHAADGTAIPIECRAEEEMTCLGGQRLAPIGSRALNPAFDVTPGTLVTGFITESGIIPPDSLSRIMKRV